MYIKGKKCLVENKEEILPVHWEQGLCREGEAGDPGSRLGSLEVRAGLYDGASILGLLSNKFY